MALCDWSRIEKETLSPLVARQVIHTEKLTLARIFLMKGAVVPEHAHPNEQFTTLETGSIVFTIEGVDHVITAGQSVVTPPNAVHTVRALEDSVALDVFTPVREDWIRGDDAYLRG